MLPLLGLLMSKKTCLGIKKVAQTAKLSPIWSLWSQGKYDHSNDTNHTCLAFLSDGTNWTKGEKACLATP